MFLKLPNENWKKVLQNIEGMLRFNLTPSDSVSKKPEEIANRTSFERRNNGRPR